MLVLLRVYLVMVKLLLLKQFRQLWNWHLIFLVLQRLIEMVLILIPTPHRGWLPVQVVSKSIVTVLFWLFLHLVMRFSL